MAALPRRSRLWSGSPFLLPRSSVLDAHDDWNLITIGALNLAHATWWTGLVSGSVALNVLFAADAAYLLADTFWLIFVPSCVPNKVRKTLLVHHMLVCAALPVAAGKPILMQHMLRTWIVELNSWTHIAARRLSSSWLATWARSLNKPLFLSLRIVAFPLTYLVYVRQRAALTPQLLASHAPLRVHGPLSIAHFAMYGLMLKWGYSLLLGTP